MGYTTEFEGALRIDPPLNFAQAQYINNFCECRHGTNNETYKGCPGFNCDWETDGNSLYWNGSEKSYCMDDWIKIIIDLFIIPFQATVNGIMFASGERSDDRWTIKVVNNHVTKGKWKPAEI